MQYFKYTVSQKTTRM